MCATTRSGKGMGASTREWVVRLVSTIPGSSPALSLVLVPALVLVVVAVIVRLPVLVLLTRASSSTRTSDRTSTSTSTITRTITIASTCTSPHTSRALAPPDRQWIGQTRLAHPTSWLIPGSGYPDDVIPAQSRLVNTRTKQIMRPTIATTTTITTTAATTLPPPRVLLLLLRLCR